MKKINLAFLLLFVPTIVLAAGTTQQSAYPVKANPAGTDKALITDPTDGNRTKNVLLSSLPVSTPVQNALNLKVNTSVLNTLATAALSPNTNQIVSWNGSNWTTVDNTGGSGGGILHAPSDGAYYGSHNGAWAALTGIFVVPSGSITGTSGGLSGQYIDWNITTGGASIKNRPTIPTTLSSLADDATHRLTTDTQQAAWSAKADANANTTGTSRNLDATGLAADHTWGGTNTYQNLVYTNISSPYVNGSMEANFPNQTSCPTPVAGMDRMYNCNHQFYGYKNGGTASQIPIVSDINTQAKFEALVGWSLPGGSSSSTTIASGTSSLGTSAIASGACAAAVTTTATGAASTDVVNWGFNSNPTGVTGYIPSASGMLSIIAYPTTGNVVFLVCNNLASSVTPGSITLNWRIIR